VDGEEEGRLEMYTFLKDIEESFHLGTIADSKIIETPVSEVR